jgi:ABC-type phosphate/phosphonate transport system substrate-binding protein
MAEMGSTPDGKKILTQLYRIDGLVPATSKDYEPVRQAARVLKVD